MSDIVCSKTRTCSGRVSRHKTRGVYWIIRDCRARSSVRRWNNGRARSDRSALRRVSRGLGCIDFSKCNGTLE